MFKYQSSIVWWVQKLLVSGLLVFYSLNHLIRAHVLIMLMQQIKVINNTRHFPGLISNLNRVRWSMSDWYTRQHSAWRQKLLRKTKLGQIWFNQRTLSKQGNLLSYNSYNRMMKDLCKVPQLKSTRISYSKSLKLVHKIQFLLFLNSLDTYKKV